MRQSQVWKKRQAGLDGGIKGEARQWLESSDEIRQEVAAANAERRKAGLKRRRY